jgi:hypothetical protein
MFDSIRSHLSSARGTLGLSADRRRPEPRESVALAAEIERDGRRVPIEIGNISANGLMASVDGKLPVDTPLAVWIDGHRVTGHVRWSGEGRFGMRFTAPIKLETAVVERYRPACVEQAKQMSRWMV